MSLIITVSFPRPISVLRGTLIKIIGAYEDKDRARAYHVIDGTKGMNYSALSEEFLDPLPQFLPSSMDFTLPLIGHVVSCYQGSAGTTLHVQPSDYSPYDYNNICSDWFRMSLPAYDKILEEKREWKKAIKPIHLSSWERYRYCPEPIDTREIIGRLQPAFGSKPNCNIRRAAEAFGQCSEKQSQSARHVERLRIIDELRLHLYQEAESDVRTYLLKETREESVLTAEAAIITIFSSLDILSHALNEVFCLGLGEREATFFSVLAVRTTGVEDSTKRCLESDFPDNSVTKFLIHQRGRWIQELSEWRHHVVHHGCLNGGEYVDGVALIAMPNSESLNGMSVRLPVGATDLVGKWANELRATLETTFSLVGEYLDELSGTLKPDSEKEIDDPITPSTYANGLEVIESFLKLWIKSDIEEPKRVEFMFARLATVWQKEWGINQFRNFITQNQLLRFDINGPLLSGTDLEYGFRVAITMRLTFRDKRIDWHFLAVTTQGGKRFRLIRRPSSTLPTDQKFAVNGFSSRQSGMDTFLRDLVFSAKIENVSAYTLEQVEAHVFWHDLSEAKVLLGTIFAGETRSLECSWPEGCVPIAGLPALWTERGHFRLRIVYKLTTPEGNWWAEDHGPDKP